MAERDVYINTVAKKFDVQASSIRSDVDRLIAKKVRAFKRDQSQKVKQESAGYADRVNPDAIKAPAVTKNEETVLGLMLLFPDHRSKIFKNELLTEDDFVTDLNRRVFAYIRRAYETGDDSFTSINDEFTQDEIGRISRMKIRRMELSSNDDSVLYESINNLKKSVEKKNSKDTTTVGDLEALLSKIRSK